MDTYVFTDELYHYGRSKRDGAKIGSGRYHLGSGENPRAEKRRLKERLQARSEAKAAKKLQRDAANREKLIRSGNVQKATKRFSDFTDEELDRIIERSKKLADVKRLSEEHARLGAAKMESMEKTIKSLASSGESFVKLYNVGAAVANTFGMDLKKVDLSFNNQGKEAKEFAYRKKKDELDRADRLAAQKYQQEKDQRDYNFQVRKYEDEQWNKAMGFSSKKDKKDEKDEKDKK